MTLKGQHLDFRCLACDASFTLIVGPKMSSIGHKCENGGFWVSPKEGPEDTVSVESPNLLVSQTESCEGLLGVACPNKRLFNYYLCKECVDEYNDDPEAYK